MENFWRFKASPFTKFILSCVYMLNLMSSVCWSLNNEGVALLRLKEKLGSDPFGSLSTWREQIGEENPCCWFGVECLDGHVVSLNLKDLCLKGILPSEIGELIYIKSIILRNNSFSGVVPEEISNLEELQMLDIGYNNFSGELHHDSSSMSIVLFDNNELLENRNPELFLLQTIYGVPIYKDLFSQAPSCNQLLNSGKKSGAMGNMARRRLQDPFTLFPPPDLPTFSPPSPPPAPASLPTPSPDQSPFPGISELSPSAAPPTPLSSPSIPAPGDGPSMPAPAEGPQQPTKSSRRKNHQLLIILSATGGSLMLLLAVGVIFWQCGNVATVRPWATGLSGQLRRAFVTGVPKLRRSELEAACEDFSNVIGSSPFLSLYKGTLSNGTEIAVASIAVASAKDWSNSLESQLRNKIATLSRVNHKNFASLLGYCVEDEPFTRMMVFEYAPNGTLFEHLHIREAEHLDWTTRMRIAMGIAYCLEHMHQLTPPFAHRGFNSSAVYLTEDYAAKVSDFSFFGESSSSETEPNVSSNVYSFGVILLEMTTGRLPYAAGSNSLDNWASDYLTGTGPLRELVDPTLETYNEDQLQRIGDVIRSCASADPRQRPNMGEVCARMRDVTRIDPDGAVPRLSPLWWAEVEIMSADAS